MSKKVSPVLKPAKKPAQKSRGENGSEPQERNRKPAAFTDHQREFLDNLHEVVFSLDLQGIFTYINPSIQDLSGYLPNQVIGKSFEDFIHPEDLPGLKASLARTLSGQQEPHEFRVLDMDGRVIPVLTSSHPIQEGKKILGVNGIMMKMTAFKKAEKALLEARQEYTTLIDQVPAVFYTAAPDAHHSLLSITSQVEKLSGYTPEQWISDQALWRGAIHPQDQPRILEERKKAHQSGKRPQSEYRLLGREGQEIWVRDEATLIRNENGKPLFWQGILLDINEQKKVELALGQRVDELAAFQATMLDLAENQDLPTLLSAIVERSMALLKAPYGYIYLYDPLTAELELKVDRGFPSEPGVKVKLGEGLTGRVARDRQPLIVQNYKTWEGRSPIYDQSPYHAIIEVPMVFGGELIGVLGVNDSEQNQREYSPLDARLLELFAGLAASAVHNARLVQGLQSELRERQRVEESLRDTEARYRALVEQIPAIVYSDSAENIGQTHYISPQIKTMLGFEPEEWSRNNDLWTASIHPDDRQRVLDEYNRSFESGESFTCEYRMTSRSGETVWIRDEAILIRDASGKPLFWQGMMLDITGRRDSEVALEESEERYHRLFDLSPDAIAVHSSGKIVLANTTALNLMGAKDLSEILGKPMIDFVHPDYRQKVIERTQQQVLEGKVVPVLEEKFIRMDGTALDVEVTAAPIHFQDSIASLVIFRNITERRRAQDLQEAVYQIAVATETTKSLNDLFPQIHKIISSVMPSENFYITLYDEEQNLLRFPYFMDEADEPYMQDIQPGLGLTAYVLRTGKSLLCTQAVHDELERQGAIKLLGVPSAIWLGVPLIIAGKTIGVMVVQHYTDPAAYGERDQHMLEFVSTQVAIAISRKQADDALQRQVKELSVLHTVSKSAAEATSMDGLIQEVTRIIGEAIYVDDFGVALFDEEARVLKPHPSYHGESFGDQATIPLTEGIMGHVASTGLPYRVADAPRDAYYVASVPETRSEICVPIKVGDKLFGVINAESRELNYFSADDERLLTTIAGTLATACEKLGLFESEHNRRQEAETLRQVAQVVTSSLDMDEVVRLMLHQLKALFSFDTASVLLIGKEGQPGKFAGMDYANEKPTSQAADELLKNSVILKQMAADMEPVIIPDVREHPGWIWTPGGENVRSFLGVPLVARGQMTGVLMIDSSNCSHFNGNQARVAQLLAQQMAIALENARLYQDALQAAERRLILHRVSQDMVTAIQEPEQTYLSIHQATRKLMPCDSFVIALHNEITNENLVVYALEGDTRLPKQQVPAGRGLTGKILASGEAVIIDDLLADKTDVIRMGQAKPIRSLVAVPLRLGAKTTGMISAQSYNQNAFGPEEQALLEMLASYAAVAIENARLYQDAVRAAERRSILHEVSQEIVKVGLDLERVYQAVHHAAGRLMPGDAFVLSVLDEARQEIEFAFLFDEGKRWYSSNSPIGIGLSGQVISTGLPVRINDLESTPLMDAIDFGGGQEIRSILAVPLRLGSKVFGMLSVQSYHPYSYTEEDQALLEMLGAHAAVAIENTRLYESEQSRLQESETLREAVAAVASTLDQNRAVELILDQVGRVVPYDSASVMLMRDDHLEIVGGKGWKDPSMVLGLRFPIPGDNPDTQVVQQRSPVFLSDAQDKYPSFRQPPHNQIRSWMGVPMIVRDRVVGILTLDGKQPNQFSQESVRLVSAFANQAASTIENARLYEEAVQAAERRAILHRASQEIAQASQDSEQVYQAVHRAAVQLMPAEAFVITLLDKQSQETVGVYLVDKGGRWQSDRAPAGAGLSGRVMKTGEPVITHDLLSDPIPGSVHFGEEDEVRSLLAVPLKLGTQVIGMLSVQSYKPYAYSRDDQSLLEMLAAHAAVAIENARLYVETLRRLKELETVNRISTALRAAQTLDEMLPALLYETLQLMGTDSGVIWLYDPAAGMLLQKVASGWFRGIQEQPVKPGEGIAGKVFETGNVTLSSEFAKDSLTRESSRGQIPTGWGGACIPIRTVREIIGVMFVSVQLPRKLEEDALHLLVTLSEMAGNAIRRVDLNEQTERQLQRMASLRAVDMAINTILDLRVTLGILIDHIISQLKVDAVNILLINPKTQSLYHAASSGFHSDTFKSARLYFNDDLAGQAIRTRTTLHIANLRETRLIQRGQLLLEEGFVTYYGVPLLAKGQVKGVLEIFHRSSMEPDSEWLNFLETLAGQAAIAIDNSVLFEELQQTNLNLSLAYDATIEGWSKALDLRDEVTEGHTLRVTEMTVQLADILGIGAPDLVNIRRGALLHDIGKMGVPDSILHKAGPLTRNEWEIMHRHPVFAFEMLSPINYLRQALDIPYCHHERWDGSGYPRHLSGEQIPMAARIFAVVDVWDALTSDRPYRKAHTKNKAADYIRKNSGKLFDPHVVETFLRIFTNPAEPPQEGEDQDEIPEPGDLY